MATSITASTVSPFTGLALTDAVYTATANLPSASVVGGATAAIYMPNVDYPTVGQFIVQLFNTALTNTTGSQVIKMSLQESNDGTTWNTITALADPLLTATDTGAASSPTTPAGSVQVLLTPNAKPYLRATASVAAGGSTPGGITGSFGVELLF